MDAKDKSFSAFLTSLPSIPASIIETLQSVCEDQPRAIIGFIALRDLLESRPPVRPLALRVLLELCTHVDRKTRVLAIQTVRRWVPDSAMSQTIVDYGLGVLQRLVSASQDTMEVDDAKPPVESRYLGEVNPDTVQQHVELAFALSRREQDLLDDIFAIYPKLVSPIADAMETLLTPLVQSLGPSTKLLEVLRRFPAGSEKLALRVVTILSAEGASQVLVSLVKGLMSERDLDPGFIIPIIGELDKVSKTGRSDASRLTRVGRRRSKSNCLE